MSKKAPQVYKSNALVEASYRLSVVEQRVVLACIDQVRRDEDVTDEVMYSINPTDYANVCGISVDMAYRDLKKAAYKLMDRKVWLTHTPEGKRHPETLVTHWIQAIKYSDGEAELSLCFAKHMLPYLTQFRGAFTRYALSDVAKMDSAHAIRLYELLVERLDFGNRKIEIDWLRHAFQLADKYPKVAELKRWVIEPAIKQINERSPLHVEYTQSKLGRRITHLHFKFQTHSLPKERREVDEPQQTSTRAPDRDPKGRTYGIKNSDVLAAQREGEDFEDAAYRLMFERKQTSMEL